MAAKPKAKKAKDETPERVHPEVASAPTPIPPSINDVRGDDEAVLGHFVDVVSGEYKGRYGVFEELTGDVAVVRTRDNDSLRFSCKVSDLVPAEAGRR